MNYLNKQPDAMYETKPEITSYMSINSPLAKAIAYTKPNLKYLI